MKKGDIISGALLMACAAVLFMLAPDRLSMALVAVMAVMMGFGYFRSILPSSHYSAAFRHATAFIQKTRRLQPDNLWVTVANTSGLFMNDTLDGLFQDYKEKIKRRSREASRSLYDVSDVINVSVLEMKTWQRVTSQIPNMLTALGILGTFIGLISGISGIHFSTVEVAISSVQGLLEGISTAFYTSVCGVVLSIVYNFTARIMWNIMLQNMDTFYHDFHMYVSDTADVRDKLLRNANARDILLHLDRLISLQREESFGHEEK